MSRHRHLLHRHRVEPDVVPTSVAEERAPVRLQVTFKIATSQGDQARRAFRDFSQRERSAWARRSSFNASRAISKASCTERA